MSKSIENIEGVVVIEEEVFFNEILKLSRSIIYMSVAWSGPERMSRAIVSRVLAELKFDGLPIFFIDCSDQTKDFVVDWLHYQKSKMEEFYYGGWGETLFVKNGEIVDYIKYPSNLGMVKTKSKISSWLESD